MNFMINAAFECGNIELISQELNVFELKIRKDSQAAFSQWFYFAINNMAGQACQFKFLNAAHTSYPAAWEGYQALASYDRKEWFRVPSRYENGIFIIDHTSQQNLIFYAYFAPYSYEDYLNWLASIQTVCHVEPLAITHDNRMSHLIQIGEPAKNKYKCWFIARQHSGEAMASWFVEGLVKQLLDNQDALTKSLLENAVFYIVPLMNPDGVARGNLRANAHGLDLNRQWQRPDQQRCPEVFYTREKMHQTGVDFFMDIHGDETIPYVFLATCSDNLNHSLRQQQLEDHYMQALLAATPEFQTEYGYEKSQFKESTPTLACNHVGEHFDCLAFTLEMPFKDNNNLPDSRYGWSPERSANFARPVLESLHKILPNLR